MTLLRFVTSLLSAALLLAGVSARAEGWKHVHLQSTDHTRIRIDYQVQQETAPRCYKCTVPAYAHPLWIHVENSGLNPRSRVHVVLLNWRHFPWSPGDKELETQEIELGQETDGHFSTQLTDLVRINESGYSGTFKHTQELAIAINGNWLTDPISDSHNFKLNLWDAAY